MSAIPVLLMLAASAGAAAYAETMPTDGGVLNVDFTTTPNTIVPGEEVRMNIDFINPQSGQTQIHIDYFVTVLEDENVIFGPTNRLHTSEGKVSIPIIFQREGSYDVKIDADGILFNEIPMETVTFAVLVGQETINPDPGNGGCLIATATYGSELADEVQTLREIRDGSLMATNSGAAFMSGFNQVYYAFSPTIADWERQNPAFKELVKITITPMIASLSILSHVSMDSEAEVIGYGAGIIMLNVGLYVGVPAFAASRIAGFFKPN